MVARVVALEPDLLDALSLSSCMFISCAHKKKVKSQTKQQNNYQSKENTKASIQDKEYYTYESQVHPP